MANKTNYPNPLLRGGPQHKHYDRDNTTTTPLAGGATFTGVKQLNTFNDVMVECATDQDGILYLDFSGDGVNWDASTPLVVVAGVTLTEVHLKGPRYFRVRLTNTSGTTQTYLRLHTYHGDMAHQAATTNAVSTTSFNSRAAATLAAGATFQGVGEEVSMYGRAGIAVVSDNATDGVLTIEVSQDNVTWGGPTRTWADTRFSQPHMWNIVEKYFRIKYVNGTTEATNLAIQVQYSINADIFLAHQMTETFKDETEAIATRSVLVGVDNDGVYRNVPVDDSGQLAVNVHDQKTRSLDFFFGRLDNLTTLSADANPEDTTLTLTTTTGFTAGKTIGVFSADIVDDFYLGGQIGAPVGSVVTVDTPVDVALASTSAVAAVTTNMAVDGATTTQIFQIGPVAAGSTSVVDITRVMGHILDSTAMDDGKFGGITALTNGVVLRKTDGVITNLWNVKTNADLQLLCYDFSYSDKAPGGQFGCNWRNSYAGQGNHGVVLELLPGEYLEVLIQDDLTGLDSFTMMAQGHFKD